MWKWLIGLGVGGAVVYLATRPPAQSTPSVPSSPLTFLPPGTVLSQQA